MKIRTAVGILGAGPAGLTLARLLQLTGIDCVVIEARTQQYIENRVRAGVLEQGTVDLLTNIGAGQRMREMGLVHHGIELRFAHKGHRIDMHELTGGKAVTIYAQQEVIRDLINLRLTTGGELLFECEDATVSEIDSPTSKIQFGKNGNEYEVICDFIAGCDGFHGVSRPSFPPGVLKIFERTYPFAWLGILANAPPPSEELIYTHHQRGFALVSMRSPSVSRLYLQCSPEEDLNEWPNSRIWEELHCRLATRDGNFTLQEGPVTQKGITGMRSFVVEPMQYGNLFLAGDAAHIVPPTGAKGLNLAVADVIVLAEALTAFYRTGSRDALKNYSQTCLRRIWKVQRFSWWMTSMLHIFEHASDFDGRRQSAELDYVTSSKAGATTLAENYVGLPMN
ncbi:MAG: 4-hydroxybenzoate 3-monooxygenase [Acidobacteriaceae bacterium]|nr:4-hydroxybenzoate 3-monooxygenase [Acidobacteriaceae bacterium]